MDKCMHLDNLFDLPWKVYIHTFHENVLHISIYMILHIPFKIVLLVQHYNMHLHCGSIVTIVEPRSSLPCSLELFKQDGSKCICQVKRKKKSINLFPVTRVT